MSAAEAADFAGPRPAGRDMTAIRRWLYLVALLIVAMVVVGGATRLTHSGLSITEWQPILGVVPPFSEAAWQEDVARLLAEHRQLRDLATHLDPRRLHTPSRGSKATPATLLRGIAFHDIYHAGQIQLLKRLARD